MLIVTTIDKQPEDFQLLAQNMQTYDVCGYTEQDEFRLKEVTDIPVGFEQRVLPGQYGQYLSVQQINTGLLLENERLQDIDLVSSIAFVQMAQTEQIDNVTITEHPDLFPRWTAEWTGKAGTILQDEGQLYKSIHDVGNGQNTKPSETPAMWTGIGNPAEEWSEWIQPIGSHDAYSKGDKATHKNKKWISTADGNVWEPGVYGWTEIEE